MYRIKVDYQTGDSFHTEDTSEILSPSWSNPEVAKQNLVRIKEHNDWASGRGWYSNPKPKPPSFVKKNDERYHLDLLLDDGSEQKVCASWVGYFESLHGASIIADEQDGWSFKV